MMFSIGFLPLQRLWPRLDLTAIIGDRRRPAADNRLDLEEMPDSWKRDLGLMDGRDPPGPAKGDRFRAEDLIHTRRNL
ncbi:hypothetical protein [Rhizobium sp. LCM 4573]|uniref:hypothetical protein n=1 Tax=Rhizobium sp. LCM 4573 TaxID=1848291 RepID=UPI0012FF8711|nr:hypothetical protein [Rhizobium sp. LCM 4573]